MIEAGGLSRLLAFAEKWQKPVFPVKGVDLAALGIPAGPKLGASLKTLEDEWIESGFSLDRDALLERAARISGN
jgi:tRNA nucleotidyltransferase/poly(A) polymerase